MTAIFFDLDDTIYLRSDPFDRTCAALLPHLTEDQRRRAFRTCRDRGDEVFPAAQRGEISEAEMYRYRYRQGFADVGVTIDDPFAWAFYEEYIVQQRAIAPSPAMQAVLSLAQKKFDRVGILTNGESVRQRDKVRQLGILQWAEESLVFVSGDAGRPKPDPYLFETAMEATGLSPQQLWMVGDSYEADVCGAAACGWHTVWLNRDGAPMPTGSIVPDVMVESEAALLSCLECFAFLFV